MHSHLLQKKMTDRVAVITGFYESPNYLITLFQYLEKQTYKVFDVYVYNYSHEEIEALDKGRFSFNCKILKIAQNIGFAGGNNFALKEARKQYDYSFYALINDDTKPDAQWLENLVITALADSSIGAVASKMVYYENFITIGGKTEGVKIEDSRNLGVRFYANTSFDRCTYSRKFYLAGFHNQEEDEIYNFRWTDTTFRLAIPVIIHPEKKEYKLQLFLRKNSKIQKQQLKLSVGNFILKPLELSDDKIYYELYIPGHVIKNSSYRIIQNAGSDYDRKYNGFDIGAGEIDNGQFDSVKEVTMFCGGACLLSKKALEDTGLFNGRFFSYYEDSDLSLRLKRKGYRIIYCPQALVMHYHSATSQEWSPFFTYHVFRNKIIFSGKNFGLQAFIAAFYERLKETWFFFRWASKNRFRDPNIKARLKLNTKILIDSLIGILKYNPTKF